MKEFLLSNYKLVILIICAVLELVSLIVLSLKKSKVDEPFLMIVSKLPSIIALTEFLIGSGKGYTKKTSVLQTCIDLYKDYTGIKISNESKIARDFSEAIEEILSTPQKKGVDNDK